MRPSRLTAFGAAKRGVQMNSRVFVGRRKSRGSRGSCRSTRRESSSSTSSSPSSRPRHVPCSACLLLDTRPLIHATAAAKAAPPFRPFRGRGVPPGTSPQLHSSCEVFLPRSPSACPNPPVASAGPLPEADEQRAGGQAGRDQVCAPERAAAVGEALGADRAGEAAVAELGLLFLLSLPAAL